MQILQILDFYFTLLSLPEIKFHHWRYHKILMYNTSRLLTVRLIKHLI
jgi:hypothetical protein